MIGQAIASEIDLFRGRDVTAGMPHRGVPARLDRDAMVTLQRIDIFDAVWSGALSTSFAPQGASSASPASLRLVNTLQHRSLGTVAPADLMAALNIEQARTLFLCNLSLVQEKLRDTSSEGPSVRFDIPVNAGALATLGGELRIIAQHTPDLFGRIQVTHSEDDHAGLSPDQIGQLKALEALGLRLQVRRSSGAPRAEADIRIDRRLPPSMRSTSAFTAYAAA